MDGHPQIIFVPRYMKKFLLLALIISVLAFSVFLGINYSKNNLASLLGVITAWVTINPLEVEVSPVEVEVNKVFKVTAEIINKGEERIKNAEAEIRLPEGLVLLKKDSVQRIGVIPGKKGKNVHWSVKGEQIGNYVVSIIVSGELKETLISAQDSAVVEVIEKSSPGGGRGFNFFQRVFDFFQKWFRF